MTEIILFPLRRLAMWLVWEGPYLGSLAPILFDFAMGQKGKCIDKKEGDQ